MCGLRKYRFVCSVRVCVVRNVCVVCMFGFRNYRFSLALVRFCFACLAEYFRICVFVCVCVVVELWGGRNEDLSVCVLCVSDC